MRGKVTIENSIHTAMIRIGFHTCPECNPADETRLSIGRGGYYGLTVMPILGEARKL